ncbi:beta-lactamase family protein [Kordiimonas laminariae]|uniref:beta-lactamase family protein n=1 Tax=Kordiimonas laminariae TaxID=2917717 RepID=UPI001FF2A2B1|nr:beta-lactamase family protein [Kordiimonas laminariae]MCK0070215.1 beta-lactamase family protein [Kordiimonas laminariae]
MKAKLGLALIYSLVLMLFTPLSVYGDVNKAELKELVDGYASKQGFSGTVLIARGGEILVEASYGEADIEWGVPNTPSALYRIGSLSKPLTATLVMALVEDGILSLDGTLADYLPDIYGGTPVAGVTVAQLLSHLSAIQDVPGNYNDPWWQTVARQSFAPETFAREWIKPTLNGTPGERWRYNNSGFYLLGVIVERVTGKSYAENLQTHIFGPAGMQNSGVYSNEAILKGLAQGYSRDAKGDYIKPLHIDASVSYAAAGVYSSARDIYRFDRALYGDALLSAESRTNMLTAKTAFPYGFGWGVEHWDLSGGVTLDVVSHTGSIPGYQSYYLRSEAAQDCVIVLNNKNQGGLVIQMGQDLMRVLNGKHSLAAFLMPINEAQGTAAMVAAFENLGDDRSRYDVSESQMNRLGYRFLRGKHLESAIAVFRWNTELYPNSANTFDSLGEAYRTAGQQEKAIESYQKALALAPESPSATAALKELEANK